MRLLISRFLIGIALLFCINQLIFADNLPLFSNELQAQQHCPGDEVVWLNTKTGIWHVPGNRWYGNTNNGAFVCKREAVMAGDRASLRG